MLTDINHFIQKKIDGVWTTIDNPLNDDRNKHWFQALAGEGYWYLGPNDAGWDDIPSIVLEPRGLPQDLTDYDYDRRILYVHDVFHFPFEGVMADLTLAIPEAPPWEWWFGGLPTDSWTTSTEILAWRAKYGSDEALMAPMREIFDLFQRLHDEHGEVRFIYNFD